MQELAFETGSAPYTDNPKRSMADPGLTEIMKTFTYYRIGTRV